MTEKTKASVSDLLLLIPHLVAVFFAAVVKFIALPFTNRPRAASALKDVAYSAIRQHIGGLNTFQEQYFDSSTEEAYRKLASSQNFEPDTEVLPSGLKLHWIGSRQVTKVILYCHGGGYALSCSFLHFQWLLNLHADLSKDHDVSIAVFGYTLSPKGQYPLQLKQAVESLRFLIEQEGRRPKDVKSLTPQPYYPLQARLITVQIICAGESAGGNLCLGLLSHLLHPHPEIKPLHLSEPLAGAVLSSPWVELCPTGGSVTTNAETDLIPVTSVYRWADQFLGDVTIDNYTDPHSADPGWFAGLENTVADVLIWAGACEIFIDSVRSFTAELEKVHPRIRLVVQERACHVDYLFDPLFGYKTKPEATRLIESWIGERL